VYHVSVEGEFQALIKNHDSSKLQSSLHSSNQSCLALDKSWSRLSSSFRFWLTAALAIGFDCGVDEPTENNNNLFKELKRNNIMITILCDSLQFSAKKLALNTNAMILFALFEINFSVKIVFKS
jgi:hypothetical protein